MNTVLLDAKSLYEMLANGYRNLKRMESQVNDLNVFPIPDGDTGTNMAKTIAGGVQINIDDYTDVSSMMKQFSKSVLLSARGNSGVILSQYIRGWANGAAGKEAITISDMAHMMQEGVKSAYNAVPTPVEGTMLTVLREPCEALDSAGEFQSFAAFFNFIIQKMKISLQNTPELLPVLKEAGVVDSGGVGIVYIIEGICAYLDGEIIEADQERESSFSVTASSAFGPDSVLEYGYCTEFILQLMHAKTNISTFSINEMISYMETIGDSIVAVQDEDIVKVHVHTFTPEKALAFGRNYGEFINVKIENMSIQHNEAVQSKPKETKRVKYAIIAVVMGEGIQSYFKEIGANFIIDGGQTQNPSAQQFLDAFASLNAEHIVVLPNNSNIYATAKQAADMYTACDVRVLETKSIAEGYSALSMMNTWAEDIESFISDMTMGLGAVTSGSITKAVHDATLNGIDIKENMYMGIANGKVLCTAENSLDAALQMLSALPDIDDKSVITIFYGEAVSDEDAEALTEAIIENFPHIECGAVPGRQKIYDYHMAIE